MVLILLLKHISLYLYYILHAWAFACSAKIVAVLIFHNTQVISAVLRPADIDRYAFSKMLKSALKI